MLQIVKRIRPRTQQLSPLRPESLPCSVRSVADLERRLRVVEVRHGALDGHVARHARVRVAAGLLQLLVGHDDAVAAEIREHALVVQAHAVHDERIVGTDQLRTDFGRLEHARPDLLVHRVELAAHAQADLDGAARVGGVAARDDVVHGVDTADLRAAEVQRRGLLVVALRDRERDRRAALARNARVARAGVAVVTRLRLARALRRRVAHVAVGAGVAVRTGGPHDDLGLDAGEGITELDRAGVAVVGHRLLLGHAHPLLLRIRRRRRDRFVAGVVDAGVAREARAIRVRLARRVGTASLAAAGAVTRIADRQRVVVVADRAGRLVGRGAAALAVAGIERALLAVVAHLGRARSARAILADVAVRADVAVVARVGVGRVDAALDLVARVGRARILVVALQLGADAGAVLAGVARGAGVVVRALRRDRRMHAALGLVARVAGARTAVVAIDLRARARADGFALVARGAGVAVVAALRLRRRATDHADVDGRTRAVRVPHARNRPVALAFDGDDPVDAVLVLQADVAARRRAAGCGRRAGIAATRFGCCSVTAARTQDEGSQHGRQALESHG